MKFTVEIEEFWLEEEDLSLDLKTFVKSEVIKKINSQIEKKVEDQITRQVKNSIEKSMIKKVDKIIENFLSNGKIKGDYSSDGELTIEEYIKKKFDNKNGWGNPNEKIEKLAKNFGEDLKNRYDLVFATQIVKSLDKQGFLKDNIAKMLLENNK